MTDKKISDLLDSALQVGAEFLDKLPEQVDRLTAQAEELADLVGTKVSRAFGPDPVQEAEEVAKAQAKAYEADSLDRITDVLAQAFSYGVTGPNGEGVFEEQSKSLRSISDSLVSIAASLEQLANRPGA